MDAFGATLLDTDWGMIIIGFFLLLAVFIDFFFGKPKT